MDPDIRIKISPAEPLTVTQLSQLLKTHIENEFSEVRIRGEVSSCKRHTSGHLYFSLKDADTVIDAICWRSTKLSIPVEDGLSVICSGRITTYPGRSKYQVIVRMVQHEGVGSLLQLLEERKKILAAEGLFNRKRPLPFFPEHIGLITSPVGAVIQDMLHRIQDRLPCRISLYPATVQGDTAAQEIVAGLKVLAQIENPPDVIIVARGGGSIEDLWPFNDEALARAVFASPIPVVSAVGHETDTTLIDYVSDMRAPTPTAAAEFVCPSRTHLLAVCAGHQQRLVHIMTRSIKEEARRLEALLRQLVVFLYRTELWTQRLDDVMDRLSVSMITYLDRCLYKQTLLAERLCSPLQAMAFYAERLGKIALNRLLGRFIEKIQERLTQSAHILRTLSYQRILERGFSIVTQKNGQIALASTVQKGDTLVVRCVDGQIETVASKVSPKTPHAH